MYKQRTHFNVSRWTTFRFFRSRTRPIPSSSSEMTCSRALWWSRQARRELRRRSKKATKNVSSAASAQVKLFGTIESQPDLFPRVKSHRRTVVTYHYGVLSSGQRDSGTDGAKLTRSLKTYVADVDKKILGEYAGRLIFAINTTHDRIRGETPFYLIHGWDARFTLEAIPSLGSTRREDSEPRRWRYNIQRQYRQARE